MTHPGKRHREPIARPTADGVVRAELVSEDAPKCLDDLITSAVAVCFVDPLELVELNYAE